MQATQLLSGVLRGFGATPTGPGTPCATQGCSASTNCSDIPYNDPYLTVGGNECTNPDGVYYVNGNNGPLVPLPWYQTTWGIIGIGASAAVVLGFFFWPGSGTPEHGDYMQGLGSKRHRRHRGRVPYGKKQTNERRAAAKTLKALFPHETREEIDRVLWSWHMANPKRTRRQLVNLGTELFTKERQTR